MKNSHTDHFIAEATLELHRAEQQLKTAKDKTKAAKKATRAEKLKLKEAKKAARKAKKKVRQAKELLAEARKTAAKAVAEAKRNAILAEKKLETAKHDPNNSETRAEAEQNSQSGMTVTSSATSGSALSTIGVVGAIVLMGLMTSTAFGGNPAEEMAKIGTTGGIDPHGDSWQSIQNSLQQFGHSEFILRLFLSLTLAVVCTWVVAWRPRRSTNIASLSDLEERKTLIILGMVGAIVAELSGSNQTLAFVIFGIGALLRFRTVLDNPKLTGKAITVVIIGLACGMGSWAMAVFVTAFSWLLIYWLDSYVSCRIKIRLDGAADPNPFYGEMQSLLVSHRCRLQSSKLNPDKRQMMFMVHMPAGLDPKQLESDIRAKLPKFDNSKINIQVE